MRWLLYTTGMFAALAGVCCLAEEASDVQSVPLAFKPLVAPEAVLAGPVFSVAPGTPSIIIPQSILKLDAKGQGTISLDGAEVEVQWAPPKGAVKLGKTAVPLRYGPRPPALAPVTLNLEGGRKYMLVFPFVWNSATGQGNQKQEARLAYQSGSVQAGAIGSTTICFYDANTDGHYSLAEDMVRVGAPGRIAMFMPASAHLATQEGIYKLESLAEDGSELKYSKYTGPTGKLEVSFLAGAADCQLAFRSAESGENVFIGSKSKADLPVIPGSYQLTRSVLTTGTGQVVGFIVPQTVSSVQVAADGTQKLALGGPLNLGFVVKRAGDKIQIDPGSFQVKGKAGEAYSGVVWNRTSPISVSLLSGGVSKPLGKMEFG